jgi:peptidoglycan-associated lipoprotein
MRRFLMVGCLVTLVVEGSNGCASKKFVRTSVDSMDDKVDSLNASLETTQERTRKNERRIEQVDGKVHAASQSAQAAKKVASRAATDAAAARLKINALDKASRRLLYDVVVNEEEGNFQFGTAALPEQARARIDELIHELQQDPQNVFIEIEGHTDDVGDPAANAKLGLARAQAVRRYLYEHHQIPLHKMNVISFGEQKPVAPNLTKEGRAQNRRVVIRVRA